MLVWRLLLHALPAALREAQGDEITAMFARELAAARGPARVVVAVTAAIDLLWNAALAHIETTARDLTDVWRSARRAPGFASSVIVVTALGIGAATAAFSLADHVLVRPLPFAAPDRLVKLWQDQSARGYSRMELSPGNFEDWRRQSTSFTSMSAYSASSMNAMTPDGPVRLDTAQVTANLFETLGVASAVGRALVAADDRSTATPPVVLSDHLWRSTFAASPDVLGTTLTLSGTAHVVVGVMPPWFEFPTRDVDLWLPLRLAPADLEDRGNVYLRAVARLRPEVSIAQARAELNVVAAGLARAFPEANDKTGATVIALRDEVAPQTRTMLLALAGASAAVLLIGCANLASLFLARSVARQRELAVRLAMGARPRRLARQLLTESLTLSAAGGVAGTLLAVVAVPVAAALVPTTLPIAGAPSLDWRMLAIAVITTMVTGVTFGVAPAWRVGRSAGAADLRQGARVVGTRTTERARSVFVVTQVAATVALLVVVGLFLQALRAVQQVHPGFDAAGVLTARTELPMPAYETTTLREAFYGRVLNAVRQHPGVTDAAYISFLPLVMRGGIWPMLTSGVTVPEDARMASVRFVTPGYFQTMRVPIVQGRDVAEGDGPGGTLVAVVSQSFAATHWPGQPPLGQVVDTPYTEPATVIGIAGDVRVRGLERLSEPQIYFAARQMVDGGATFYAPKDLVVRTAGSFEGLPAAIRRAVADADPLQPTTSIRTMQDIVAGDPASRGVQAGVLGAFAALAVLLVVVGVYGLLSYVVAARTREIGVRMALGATPAGVVGLVLSRTAALSAIGLGVGIGGAYAASRTFQALLAGISPASTGAYVTAAVVALACTFGASLPAARRAARVDPLEAMRAE